MRTTIEVCVAGLEEAVVAAAQGAERIEVCAWPESGGVTPSIGLVRAVVQATGLPVRVLVRPAPGRFDHGPHHNTVILRDVEALAREPGVQGVVAGTLTAEGMPDKALMQQVIAAADGREVTFHRAIDHAADPLEALAVCLELGVQRVLTAGGPKRAIDGWAMVRAMVHAAGDRLLVAAGGGVAADHVARLVELTGVREVHFSARRPAAPGPWDTAPDPDKTAAIIAALRNAAPR
ncbi:MAG: copper homeostasis protein CutC [Flavobacteriales bacterium]|jgi:copper homeostasis protein|nr:copper homeostasis protein CutC [Flavobacteriales bacterium]